MGETSGLDHRELELAPTIGWADRSVGPTSEWTDRNVCPTVSSRHTRECVVKLVLILLGQEVEHRFLEDLAGFSNWRMQIEMLGEGETGRGNFLLGAIDFGQLLLHLLGQVLLHQALLRPARESHLPRRDAEGKYNHHKDDECISTAFAPPRIIEEPSGTV